MSQPGAVPRVGWSTPQALAEGGFMDLFLLGLPEFEHPLSPWHSTGASCCLSQLIGLISWEDFPPRWAHTAGSPLAPGRCFFRKGGWWDFRILGRNPARINVLLVSCAWPAKNSIFFPCSCAQCCLSESATQLSAQLSAGRLSVTSSTQLHVQGDFQTRAGYQPAKHGISLPFNRTFGIKSGPFQP